MAIKILETQLANQIAAGEVVERPASVVKELLENSFDANCQQVWVDITQGGHEMMRIRDDGEGIVKDDLALAVERHATSKINVLDDLVRVASLGFRGEALASIASVSRLSITSKPPQAESGWCISNSSGDIELTPAAHPVGTTVEVRDLFYNTPARRKFMRQPRTEFSYIQTVVQRLALSRFDIAMTLTHNQRDVFHALAAEDSNAQQQRVAAILGEEFMENALAIEFEAAGMSLMGWIAAPRFTRAQGDMQYAYINGRFVRDKLLAQSVRKAYQDVLFHGRHPAYLLYLQMDPAQVDVNVHPTKHEVRFRNSRLVFDFVRRALDGALAQIRPAVPLPQQEKAINPLGDQQLADLEAVSPSPSVETSRITTEDTLTASGAVGTATLAEEGQGLGQTAAKTQAYSQESMTSSTAVAEPTQAYQATITQQEISYNNDLETNGNQVNRENTLGVAIAQLHGIYILAQNAEGLIVVDMHAAHERVLYEKLKTQLARNQLPRQVLLVPVSVSFNQQEFTLWESHQAQLAKAGLITELVGPQTVVIREVPALLANVDVAQLLKDSLTDLQQDPNSDRPQDLTLQVLATFACRSAVHANHKMSLTEMNGILAQMATTTHSGVCNHGRPTWTQLTIKDLDKLFLRGR